MGFQGVGKIYMGGLTGAPTLSRSKSWPDSKTGEEDKCDGLLEGSSHHKLDMGQLPEPVSSTMSKSPSRKIHASLKQEIMLLEKRLQNQFKVRHSLETALDYGSSSSTDDLSPSLRKNATELIKEIALLEYEVGHLEQYLLSLYRKAFDQLISTVSSSSASEKVKLQQNTSERISLETTRPVELSQRENSAETSRGHTGDYPENIPCHQGGVPLVDTEVRCHSSISQHSGFLTRTAYDDTDADEISAKALRTCHSQPLLMMDYAQNASTNLVSLAEHLGTRISDHLPETPNRLSEDMIKCMSAIYCKLCDPPLTQACLSTPNSTSSSMSQFSQDMGNVWSPALAIDSLFDTRLDNPFNVQGLKEFSGPYSTMVEVPLIYRDNQKLGDVEYLLHNFRSIISRLQEVDPRKLKHEEKLAFWINIHNSLVMHSFLAFGIPQNSVKRVLLLLKAAYNVGGHTISADTIQSSILGCRMSRPGQWIRKLIASRPKFKTGDERQGYATEKLEPLLYFALTSGNHSDPAVRAYTPKKIHQELETAKDEYIRATFGIRKHRKIILPKLVETFAKDSSLSHDDTLKTVQKSLPESLRRSIRKSQVNHKSPKVIEWIPHNFAFRYLISRELVRY